MADIKISENNEESGMFQKIHIKAYRGLKDIALDELGRVNIIVGENNTGKTSILEAIQLFKDSNVLMSIMSVAKSRQINTGMIGRNSLWPFDEFLYTFPAQEGNLKNISMDALYTVEGSQDRYSLDIFGNFQQESFFQDELPKSEQERFRMCCTEEGELRYVQGEFTYEGPLGIRREEYYFRETQPRPCSKIKENPSLFRYEEKVVYISPLDIYSNKVINASLYKGMRVEEKKDLIRLLQLFDERIIGIEVGIRYGSPAILVEVENVGLMPVSVFGDGLKKILTLASAVIKAENGIILIDEFETGIHKRALVQVADWLFSVAEQKHIQVFLTSHSSDAIDALVQAQKQYESDISAYRLENYMGETYVKKFRSKELYDLIRQGMDIL
ncbi:MAG: AAA family ATPase [Lachnospiraceae bacterium]|nr:AAA family ATPase [Lachnospiraceae bacterium]